MGMLAIANNGKYTAVGNKDTLLFWQSIATEAPIGTKFRERHDPECAVFWLKQILGVDLFKSVSNYLKIHSQQKQ